MFVDVKNYKLYKSFLNTTQDKFKKIHHLVSYQKKAFQNEVFHTESKIMGHAALEPLRIPISISKRVEKQKIPDPARTFFGFSVGFKDNITDIFSFKSMGDPVKTQEHKKGFQASEKYEVYIGLDLDFTLQTFYYTYYNTLDILSALGGISATIKIGLGALVPLLTFKYMVEFSNIQSRKAEHQIRIMKLKDIMKNLKEIRDRIKTVSVEKKDTAFSKECEEAISSIAEDSMNYKIVLQLSGTDQGLGNITYSKSKEVLAEWTQIRD